MNIYKIVLSHGEPVYATEQQVDQIMNYKGQLVKIKDYHENKDRFFYVNKAFIVAMYYDHKIKKQDYELVDGVYKLKKAITLAFLICAFLLLPMQSYAYTVTLHQVVSTPFAKTSESYHLDTKVLPSKKEKASSSTKNTTLAGFSKLLTDQGARNRERVLEWGKRYWSGDDLTAMDNILKKEAGYRHDAVNEIGACGIAQSNPCEKMNCPLTEEGLECQFQWFVGYLNSRYGGSPLTAWNFHLANNWY